MIKRMQLPLFLLSVVSLNVFAAETIVGQQAEKHGFHSCRNTVDGLTKFVVNKNEYSSQATWHNKNADARLFNSQIAIKYSDGNGVAILNVAPTKSGKCDSSYSSITPSEKSCTVLRETDLREWKFSGESAGLITLENKNGSLSKILLPVGTGCVSINTEVVYE